jgi:hypothetical protein
MKLLVNRLQWEGEGVKKIVGCTHGQWMHRSYKFIGPLAIIIDSLILQESDAFLFQSIG